jgi:hypothetical protein
MPDHHDDTIRNRPTLPRPRFGWQAWEATAGYIANQYSPDATLKIEIYPIGEIVGWAASFSWGEHQEGVQDRISFGDALTTLWHEVEAHHVLQFKTLEAASRRPLNYADDQWLDDPTMEVFSRLVGVTEVAFKGDWHIIIVYQPVESADGRVQARLLAQQGNIQIGGRGATLRDACRATFHNAAAKYRAFVKNEGN